MIELGNLTGGSNLPPGVTDGDSYFQDEGDYCESCGATDDKCDCTRCGKCGEVISTRCECEMPETKQEAVVMAAPKMFEILETVYTQLQLIRERKLWGAEAYLDSVIFDEIEEVVNEIEGIE